MITANALRLMNEAGEEFLAHYDDPEAVERAIDQAIADANRTLPPGTVFEIRGKIRPDEVPPTFLGLPRDRERLAREYAVAWYWTGAEPRRFLGGMLQRPLFRDRIQIAQNGPMGLYLLIARCRTPA